jgi:hypothetical protein
MAAIASRQLILTISFILSRAVAFLIFAACGGEKRKRSEDTSRSGKGLRPPAFPDNATAPSYQAEVAFYLSEYE